MSSLPFIVQVSGVICLIYLIKTEHGKKSACREVNEIRYYNKLYWEFELKDDRVIRYEEMKILIHNFYFQLLQCRNGKKNKLYILFNDQIASDQWRQLHLLSHDN